MSIEDRLNEFNDYCEGQLNSIDELSAPSHETLFKKKLYISFLESLAKAAYPKEGVKKRFILFLKTFTSWAEYNHYCPVSLENKEKIEEVLNSNRYFQIENVSIAKQDCQDNKHTYARLLYEARNSLVHQFQSSTEWEESTKRHGIETPFYEVIRTQVFDKNNQNLKDMKKSIELVFPNTFLKKLSEEGLKNFIEYCREEGLNPFPRYYAERKIFEQKI